MNSKFLVLSSIVLASGAFIRADYKVATKEVVATIKQLKEQQHVYFNLIRANPLNPAIILESETARKILELQEEINAQNALLGMPIEDITALKIYIKGEARRALDKMLEDAGLKAKQQYQKD